jgi:hypothetical protein
MPSENGFARQPPVCGSYGHKDRYIGYDIKFGVDVAVQHYTEIMIIDWVNLCFGKSPVHGTTHQNPAQTR